jgi:hypothetical protein
MPVVISSSFDPVFMDFMKLLPCISRLTQERNLSRGRIIGSSFRSSLLIIELLSFDLFVGICSFTFNDLQEVGKRSKCKETEYLIIFLKIVNLTRIDEKCLKSCKHRNIK